MARLMVTIRLLIETLQQGSSQVITHQYSKAINITMTPIVAAGSPVSIHNSPLPLVFISSATF